MARAARVIGEGGVIGWILPESVEFPDAEVQPTFAYTTIAYRVSGAQDNSCNLEWFTTWTAAAVRQACKDASQADILAKLGVTVPKVNIRMLNAPE